MARNLSWILGGGAVALGVAVGGWMLSRLSPPQADPAIAAPLAAPVPGADAPAAPTVTAEAAGAQPAPEASESALDPVPLFDVVRISREGDALVAGNAMPGASIGVMVDAALVFETEADPQGQFVAIFTLAPSDVPQVMTLEARMPDGTVHVSRDQVILTPRPAIAPVAEPEPATEPTTEPTTEPVAEPIAVAEAPAEVASEPAATEPAADPAPEPAPETVVADTATAEAPADSVATRAEEPTPEVLAAAPEPEATDLPTAFLVRESGAVEVLDRAPQVLDNLVIDSISYSAEGDVQIAGRAANPAEGTGLQIYLNNRPIASTELSVGDWTTDLPNVDPGVYTLRVDQVEPTGRVVSRFETPFLRETPEAVAEARAQTAATDAAPGASLITVQPGHTLWAISRDRYGVGELYVVIYRANRNQIRNPDLIYPGQIFTLPEN